MNIMSSLYWVRRDRFVGRVLGQMLCLCAYTQHCLDLHNVQLLLVVDGQVCKVRPWADPLFMCLHTQQ